VNILILHTQVPFVSGGAELLVAGLSEALRQRRHTVDIVALPLNWNPPDGLLTTALAWRLLDFSQFNGREVDLVICTKFPTWAVKHHRKALWLIHQHRQAYDLYGSAMSEFTPEQESRGVRERVIEIDRRGIIECSPRFAISRNVSDRLRRFCGVDAEPLYPPIPRAGLWPERYDPFVLSVARLDGAKRVDRIVAAMVNAPKGLNLVVAGDGPDLADLRRLADRSGVADRVQFRGRVSDDDLRMLYNTCRAVYYASIDEDYGYAAVEALAAGKPVITAPDSGGILEFVTDGVTGIVSDLEPHSLGRALEIVSNEASARRLGAAGPDLTANLNWDTVVDALLGK
jgi:glycosyltransferase involved in cell wall biosynthesis